MGDLRRRSLIVGLVLGLVVGLVVMVPDSLRPRPAAAATAPCTVRGESDPAPWERTLATNTIPADAKATDASCVTEVARSADSVTWRTGDGQLQTQIYSDPVNWSDSSGVWHAIDPRIVDDGNGGLVNKSGPVSVSFAKSVRPGDAPVRVANGDGSVTMRYAGSGTPTDRLVAGPTATITADAPAADATSLTYPRVVGAADLRYDIVRGGVKEWLVLNAPLSAATDRFSFVLQTDGLTPVLQPDGAVQLLNAAKTVSLEIPAATALDSSATKANFGRPASTLLRTMLVQQLDGSWLLTYVIDPAWLTSPARVYPVFIDPTTIQPQASNDASVMQEAPTNNYNGAGQFDTGCQCYIDFTGFVWPGVHWFSYMHFDLSSVSGAVISSGQWFGLSYTTNAAPTAYTIKPVSTSWNASTVTYNTRPTLRTNSVAGSVTITSNQSRSHDITTWVASWASGAWANNGIYLSGASDDFVWWAAEENSANQPYIRITYNKYPNTPTNLAPATASFTNDTTPTLSAKVTDPDGNSVHGAFEVRKNSDDTLVASGNSATVASGATASWTVPSALTNGTTYKWRVKANDGTLDSGWSAYNTFTIDTGVPFPPGVSSTTWVEGQWNAGPSGPVTFDNGGSTITGWYWTVDGPNPTTWTPLASPTVTLTPAAGWHTLKVQSKNAAGALSPVTTYQFGTGTAAITTLEDGALTQKRVTLGAESTASYDGMALEWRRADVDTIWQPVSAANVTVESTGAGIGTWPVAMSGSPDRKTTDLVWDVAATVGGTDGPVQVRARYYVGGAAQNVWSTVTYLTLDQQAFGAGYSTVPLGPGTLNTVTGNYAISATDGGGIVRVLNSRYDTSQPAGVFGPGWQSGFAAPGSPFVALVENGNTVEVTAADGSLVTFSLQADGNYRPQDGYEQDQLIKISATRYELTVADVTRTGFEQQSSGAWMPVDVDGLNSNAQIIEQYQVVGSATRLTRTISATDPTISCTPTANPGCTIVDVQYASTTTATGTTPGTWGDYTGQISHIETTAWNPQADAMTTVTVAQYQYDNLGRLRAAWDPRLTTPLTTTYDYDTAGHLSSLTPPGLEPWTFTYAPLPGLPGEPSSVGRLATVSRSTLPSGTATQTVVYQIPLSGSGAAYDLGASTVATWNQKDMPTDATAIFPADQTPSGNPPTSYQRATLYYTNVDGELVNTAQPGGSITTTEHDGDGNVVRTLTAANRQAALGAGAEVSAVQAELLDTDTTYNADGMPTDVSGPAHIVTLPDGSRITARTHTQTVYDEGSPGEAGGATPDLPTTVRVSATPVDGGVDVDVHTTVNGYANGGWALGQPTTVTVDPGGLNLTTTTLYDTTTGALIERRVPANPNGGDAHATIYRYYTAGPNADPDCANQPAWARLACKTLPAAQPGTPGLPDLPVTYYASYAIDGQPTEVRDIVGDPASPTDQRTATRGYDAIGRLVTETVTSLHDGTALPAVTHGYSTTTGLPTTTSDSTRTITRAYDTLGRLTDYQDADGETTQYGYDTLDRLTTVSDSKGSQTYSYNDGTERRGLLTTITDSGAGTFAATYDPDGRLSVETLPGGLTATRTYDETGTPTRLAYDKAGTNWLTFTQTSNARGEVRARTGPLSSQDFRYDAAGRLTATYDTLPVTGCTTRLYGFDADTNRTSLETRAPNSDGTCNSTTASSTTSSYDTADRAIDTGYGYDHFGNTVTVPWTASPVSSATSLTYFVNDRAASITTGGQTRSFALDPANRVRTETDSATGTVRTSHYADDVDAPSWVTTNTAGTTWTRNLIGFAGLEATLNEAGTITLQLANLHGDLVATASPTSATYDPATTETNEYGLARSGTDVEYDYLGTHQRQRDTNSGLQLMGARLYNATTGRFLQTDPILGGSANNYDYASGDPVNNRDLTGCCTARLWVPFMWERWEVWSAGTVPGTRVTTHTIFHYGGSLRLAVATNYQAIAVTVSQVGGTGPKWKQPGNMGMVNYFDLGALMGGVTDRTFSISVTPLIPQPNTTRYFVSFILWYRARSVVWLPTSTFVWVPCRPTSGAY